MTKERTAHHEAGHIIFAYYYGYTCDNVEILPTGDGRARLNYDNDLLAITAVTNYATDPHIFQELNNTQKDKCKSVIVPATIILIAGSIAEAIYRNKVVTEGNLEVEIAGPDLERVLQIDHFLKTYMPNHPASYVQDMMGLTMSLAKDQMEIRSAIEAIADALLKSPSDNLTGKEIESVLTNVGFLEYCKNQVE